MNFTNLINGNVPNYIKGSGNVQVYCLNEQLNNNDLKKLVFAGPYNVIINIDPNCDEALLYVKAEDNIFPILKIEASKDDLVIGSMENYSFSTTKTIEVFVQAKSLQSISVIGSGNIEGNYYGTKLSSNISGSGDIKLYGNVESLEATIQGSGDIDLKNLVSQHAQLTVAGSGDLSAFVIQSVNAKVMGSGDINIVGPCLKINEKVLGSGDISTKKNYTNKSSPFNFSTIFKKLKNNHIEPSENNGDINTIKVNKDGSISGKQISQENNTLIISGNTVSGNVVQGDLNKNGENINNNKTNKNSFLNKLKKFF